MSFPIEAASAFFSLSSYGTDWRLPKDSSSIFSMHAFLSHSRDDALEVSLLILQDSLWSICNTKSHHHHDSCLACISTTSHSQYKVKVLSASPSLIFMIANILKKENELLKCTRQALTHGGAVSSMAIESGMASVWFVGCGSSFVIAPAFSISLRC